MLVATARYGERERLGFPAHEYLAARLEMERESPFTRDDTSRAAFLARYSRSFEELEQRLRANPGVTGVTYVDLLPRTYHGWNQIEVDEGSVAPPDARGHRVSSASIDVEYFDVLGTPVLYGRRFHSGDLTPDPRVVIVNQPFVERVLGGRNPIGRRVRYVAGESHRVPTDDGPWYEIVGVARDLGTTNGYGRAGIYHPVTRDGAYPLHVAIHVRRDPRSFVPELRSVATAVDPTLRLHAVMPLDEVVHVELKFYSFWFRITVAVIALLLSLAGIYAVMSFAVALRTREIGVRVALGASPRRILTAMIRRPLTQVGAGVVVGGVLVAALLLGALGRHMSGMHVGLVAAYATLVVGVCMLACVVPTRRALRVQPTGALREDG